MKKSVIGIGWGALVMAVIALVPASSYAFGGGRGMGQGMMTQERFDELRQLVLQHTDATSFQEAMKAYHESRRSEMEARRETISHSVEKIDNGIIKTITSTDAEVAVNLQNRERPSFARAREDVTHTVENITNGVRMTITSDDEEIVARLHDRADRGEDMRPGFGKRGGHGFGRGQKRFGQTDGDEENTFRGRRGGRDQDRGGFSGGMPWGQGQ